MLTPFDVQPHYDEELRAVSIDLRTTDDRPHRTYFCFPDDVVTNEYLKSVSARLRDDENALAVAVEGVTFGAEASGRFLEDRARSSIPAFWLNSWPVSTRGIPQR